MLFICGIYLFIFFLCITTIDKCTWNDIDNHLSIMDLPKIESLIKFFISFAICICVERKKYFGIPESSKNVI